MIAIKQVSDALYLKAMLMTSPLAVTLGMSLTIPFAVLGDLYRGTELGGMPSYVGALCVLAAFVFNGFTDLSEVAAEEEGEDGGEGSISGRSIEAGMIDSGRRRGSSMSSSGSLERVLWRATPVEGGERQRLLTVEEGSTSPG